MSFLSLRANRNCLCTLSVKGSYTFSIKPKWRMTIFAMRSSAVAYLHTSVPLGHPTVDFPGPGKFGSNSVTDA